VLAGFGANEKNDQPEIAHDVYNPLDNENAYYKPLINRD